MALTLILNGQPKLLDALNDDVPLAEVISALTLKQDRVAVELNGEIARRGTWDQLRVRSGDKLEIVHFVGGGKA